VDQLLVTYDWGEAFVALSLALKPMIDDLFLKRASDLALGHNDHLLRQIFYSLNEDCQWQSPVEPVSDPDCDRRYSSQPPTHPELDKQVVPGRARHGGRFLFGIRRKARKPRQSSVPRRDFPDCGLQRGLFAHDGSATCLVRRGQYMLQRMRYALRRRHRQCD
jgi:hypothetical protein